MLNTIQSKDQLTTDVGIVPNSEIKVKGWVHYLHQDKDGNVISEETLDNVITNTGKAALAGLAGNTGSIAAFTYLATGSTNTAAVASQTALIAEITGNGGERAAATVSRVTTSQTNDTLQLVKAFAFTGTETVREIGIFNASSAGIMLCRQVPTEKAMANGDTLTVTYKVQFS